MLTEDYAVRLDSFQGPLDLLLHLIRRAEVDINEISIGQITDQYLRHLGALDRIDVEPAGEFLVTAATLVEIKSRMLVPHDDGDEADTAESFLTRESGNPAAELIRALLQYKRFREAAEKLEANRRVWDQRYPTRPLAAPDVPPAPDAEPEILDLEDVSLFDLVQAYARIADTVVFERLGRHAVVDDDTPIELHAADILDRLRAAPPADAETLPTIAGRPAMHLRSLFSGRKRVEVIGLFLAVLELVRQRAVRVLQPKGQPEVTIALSESESASDPLPLPSPPQRG